MYMHLNVISVNYVCEQKYHDGQAGQFATLPGHIAARFWM